MASWSSRGVTQDGFAKPEIYAPGMSIASTLAPNSDSTRLCPECVRDGKYFQVSGSSMAAAVTSGAAALLLQENPGWTPDQVKGALMQKFREVKGTSARQLGVDDARGASGDGLVANRGLRPSTLINPSTGMVDLTRARGTRARWTDAADYLRARWTASSFSCSDCVVTQESDAGLTRARWTCARWTSFLGSRPAAKPVVGGELEPAR